MLVLAIGAVIFMGLTVRGTDVDDFDDHVIGYDIIFHDNHDLMVVIHGHTCYYVYTPDDKESSLTQGPYVITNLQKTEASLLSHIRRNISGEVHLSSLSAMRDVFRDRLADYHCADKQIYLVDFFSKGTATGSPGGTLGGGGTGTGHVTTPGAVSAVGTTPHSMLFFCHGKESGSYPYPGDCHRFVVCSNGRAFEEPCGPGTSWSQTAKTCTFSSRVPGCH